MFLSAAAVKELQRGKKLKVSPTSFLLQVLEVLPVSCRGPHGLRIHAAQVFSREEQEKEMEKGGGRVFVELQCFKEEPS